MQLQEKYGEKFLGIAFNVEYDGRDKSTSPTSKLIENINRVINMRQVKCRNIVSTDKLDDVLKELDVIGIPAALVFDANGKLIKQFDGEFDYENDITPLVAELVASAAESMDGESKDGGDP